MTLKALRTAGLVVAASAVIALSVAWGGFLLWLAFQGVSALVRWL